MVNEDPKMSQSQAPPTMIGPKKVLRFEEVGYKIVMIKDPSLKKSMFQKLLAKVTPSEDKKKLPKLLAVSTKGA